MTPVRLRGHLGAKFGTEPRLLDVASPAEAIQALCATVPGFEEAVRTSKTRFKVLVKDVPINPKTDLATPTGRQEIRIVPVVKGAKSDFWQFIEGAALIAAAIFVPETFVFLGITGAGSAAAATALSGALMGMGAAMVIGGISRMLVGAPSGPTASDPSYLFNSAQNTQAQGVPVPVLYGEFYATPPLISEAIDTESFGPTMFNASYDGIGTWIGNGDTTPWGACLSAI